MFVGKCEGRVRGTYSENFGDGEFVVRVLQTATTCFQHNTQHMQQHAVCNSLSVQQSQATSNIL